MIELVINGRPVSVSEGATLLEAARSIGVSIPTLCHLDLHDIKAVNQVASCRVCLVEVEGRHNLLPACATHAADGMKVTTHSPRAIRARRTMVELLLSDHPFDCLMCEKNRQCDLQKLAADLRIRELKYTGEQSHYAKDDSSGALYRNPDKCILCRRCETMCNQVQTCGILSAVDRGFGTVVGPAYHLPMKDTMCTYCGQCVSVCPTAALTEVNHIRQVWEAIADPGQVVVVQTAPAVRVALGEGFGYPPGTVVTGQMTALLRRIGFDFVFDTDFAADLTIVEEAHEILQRLEKGGRLPILTSCCPAWVKFIEHQFPDLLDIPSTCKSPHEMFGAVAKSYWADKMGIDPQTITVVSVMPCLAKKYEAGRRELSHDDRPDVDYVLTTRELELMAREAGLDLKSQPEEAFDDPLGVATGAGLIFGATGGVIEAALRTVAAWLEGDKAPLEFAGLRGLDGLRTATVALGGRALRIGVAHGLGNARTLLTSIAKGEEHYDAIEIMACPGGCVSGGGQPYHHGDVGIIKARMAAIYEADRNLPIRRSHENPFVQALYKEYLGDVGGARARSILHTHYTPRSFL